MNPSFYGAKSSSEEDVENFFFTTVKESIKALAEHGCVKIEDGPEKIEDNCAVTTTVLGLAASNYYLQYHTPMQMREGAREVRNIITRKLEAQAEKKAVAEAGLDLAELEAAIADYDVRAEIERNHEMLEEARHWGVPTMVFKGEPFFGQDRIELLQWRATKPLIHLKRAVGT